MKLNFISFYFHQVCLDQKAMLLLELQGYIATGNTNATEIEHLIVVLSENTLLRVHII